MSTRRRFTGEFKAKVALEALRGTRRSWRLPRGTRFARTRGAPGSSGQWRG